MVIERKVTATGKDTDGDITKLCNHGEIWSPRYKSDAVSDIESGVYKYYLINSYGGRTYIHVVTLNGRKHLRTDPNDSTADNLDELPDC